MSTMSFLLRKEVWLQRPSATVFRAKGALYNISPVADRSRPPFNGC